MRQIRKYQKDKGRILDSNKLLYHSLPIGCILALLLLGSICINPLGFGSNGSDDKVYAADPSPEPQPDGSTNNISLSIDGNSSNDSYSKSLNAVTNQTNYIAYNVVATASNIESYSLSIKYTDGSTSLKNSTAGATTINPVASTGVQGKSMTSNTWGWGWSDNTSTANGDMTYRPMQTSDSVIKSANASSANVNGKIVFAANFGEGATAGSYSTNALLSFAIQPKAITTLADITTMQAMTSGICANTPIGNTEYTLTDTRDNKTYTVAKLKDGNCWMTQNLNLKVADLASSQLDSSTTDLADGNTYTLYANNTEYSNEHGTFYQDQVATVNSGTIGSDNAYINDAPYSICAKGWTLPTGGSNGQFAALLNDVAIAQALTVPYNFVLGGYVSYRTETGVGTQTGYWTKTGAASSSEASNTVSDKPIARAPSTSPTRVLLVIMNTTTIDSIGRRGGESDSYSIRCVAR